ncbi:hypothetical protein EG68_09891 [Paragonimus skrjabini miyazakii]|uniref:Uncharacterized protein n=1 Tax=Paragonimus skrjabini miyazakii TaxID=59628 RepID=A0A8S9YNW9_9TREM|nr:hypothetical protein EG68_09891 [Paragonimus skrjabini miyazakii]
MLVITILKFILPFLIQKATCMLIFVDILPHKPVDLCILLFWCLGQVRIKENNVALRKTVYGLENLIENLVDGNYWTTPFPLSNEYRAAFFVDLGAVYKLSSIHLYGQGNQYEGEIEQNSLTY